MVLTQPLGLLCHNFFNFALIPFNLVIILAYGAHGGLLLGYLA
ncbi:hypothetical protein HBZS_114430 [Helicobacter bizzozeronii CCUG 35545]|nr:hypothetical protein HBZS_114430 [Helicobacter bizzozeronii CCUG 35545]